MSKLGCPCGHVIDLSPYPNPNEFKVFSSRLAEEILPNIIAAHEELRDAKDSAEFAKRLYLIVFLGGVEFHDGMEPMLFCECEKCGRLLAFRHAMAQGAASITYMPETTAGPPVLLRTLAREPISNPHRRT